MAKDVKFNIRLSIDGKEHVVAAASSVRDLQKAVNDSQSSFKSAVDKFNDMGFALQGFSSAIGNLQGALQGMASGYQAALQANTQLTTVMRQRMDATQQAVNQIKQVVSAQKELGVVSGTVQIRGAQQMATFLGQKQSLMTLIPAMNNLIAQQKGVNATQEDAYSIANLMGKAMQGQTSALRRVGITFTEAQEKVMKMGTEEERAAMLAQIVTDNVGNMNAELGKTSIGKQKQLEMQLASIKAKMGEIAQTALPYVSMAAQSLQLAMSLRTLGTGIGGIVAKVAAWTAVQKACSAVQTVWTAVQTRLAAAGQLLSASMTGATVSATTLRLAIQGLMCATVIGAALAALGGVLAGLMTDAEGAADSMKQMGSAAQQSADEAKQAYDSTLKQTYSQLMQQYDALKGKWQALKTEQQKLQWVRDNQQAFRQLGMDVRSVADAESIFNGNTDKVVAAFERRAKAAAYAAELANLYGQQLQLETRASDIKLSMQVVRQKYYAEGNKEKDPYFYQNVNQKAREFAIREDKRNGGDGDIDSVLDQMDRIKGKIADVKNSLRDASAGGSLITAAETASTPAGKGTARTATAAAAAPATAKPKEKDWEDKTYDERIQALENDIKNSKNEALNEILRSFIADIEKQKQAEIAVVEKARQKSEEAAKPGTGALAQSMRPKVPQQGIIMPEIKLPKFETEAEKVERYSQALQSLKGVDLTSFESVQGALQGIKDMSGSSAQGLAAAGAACQALGGAMQQLGADSAAAKAGLVMAALGQLALSFAQAMMSASSNWITWLAFGITGTAQLLSLVATISGFATGGVVGGSSTTGDKLMIGVNSGEMILNRAQQRRLFDIANGAVSLPSVQTRMDRMSHLQPALAAAAAARPQTVRLEVRGSKLFGVLENTRRTSARRYSIT